MNNYAARYHAKRRAGMSGQRRDGTLYSPSLDLVAGMAEERVLADYGGLTPALDQGSIHATGGDAGYDATTPGGYTVEITSIGAAEHYRFFIMEADEEHRHADFFIVVKQPPPFTHLGWCWRGEWESMREEYTDGTGGMKTRKYRYPLAHLRAPDTWPGGFHG